MNTAFPGLPHTVSFVAVSGIMEKWWWNPRISHMKYIVGCESYGENHPYYGKIMRTNFPGSPHTKCFVAFFRTMRGSYAFLVWWSIPYTWSLITKKHPYYGKSMSISFPNFPHTICFAAFSYTVGNLWDNPCISHMLKYNIGWESDGKKAPILWGKYDYWFYINIDMFYYSIFELIYMLYCCICIYNHIKYVLSLP